MTKTAIMNVSTRLLGTSLALKQGERVRVTPAVCIPEGEKLDCYFARPIRGKWGDGITRNLHDSILIFGHEFDFVKKRN